MAAKPTTKPTTKPTEMDTQIAEFFAGAENTNAKKKLAQAISEAFRTYDASRTQEVEDEKKRDVPEKVYQLQKRVGKLRAVLKTLVDILADGSLNGNTRVSQACRALQEKEF